MIVLADDLRSLATDDLKKELGRAMEVTVQHVRYLASVWRELEHRGVDLSDLRHGIMTYLPLIANGKVDARVVVGYAGQKTLLGALSRLPLDEQGNVLDSGWINIVNAEGAVKTTLLSNLGASDVYQAFADDRLRTVEEQRLFLAAKSKTKRVSAPRLTRRVKVVGDRLIIGDNIAVSLDLIKELLK